MSFNPFSIRFHFGLDQTSLLSYHRNESSERDKKIHQPIISKDRKDTFINTIVVVEDDRFCRALLSDQLLAEGYNLIFVDCLENAVSAISNNDVALVVMDWVLSDCTGIAILNHLNQISDLKKSERKFKLVTLSSSRIENIQVPNSKYYEYMGHVSKPIKKKEVKDKILKFLNEDSENC